MTKYVSIAGKQHRIMTRWSIPKYLWDQYCNSDLVIYDGEFTEVFNSDGCRGCGRSYSDASSAARQPCPVLEVNKAFGFVIPICIDCYWFILSLSGTPVPRTIQEVMDNGFRPYKIYDLL